MGRLRLAPAAKSDRDYTAGRWDAAQAEHYVQSLTQSLQLLADRPGIGHSIEDIRPGYRKFAVAAHVVFYRQTEAGIDVIRILHKSMDVERHL